MSHLDAVVAYRSVASKFLITNLYRNVLVVSYIFVAQVSQNVIDLSVRWIMWWDDLVVLIVFISTGLIMIPRFTCPGGASGVTPGFSWVGRTLDYFSWKHFSDWANKTTDHGVACSYDSMSTTR